MRDVLNRLDEWHANETFLFKPSEPCKKSKKKNQTANETFNKWESDQLVITLLRGTETKNLP